jgi:hypothetical protein
MPIVAGVDADAFAHARDAAARALDLDPEHAEAHSVLGTVAFWYVGDAFYNDYVNYHAKLFDAHILNNAWWQVAWFVVVFLWATVMHGYYNTRYLRLTSGVLQLFKEGVAGQPVFQRQLGSCFSKRLIWIVLGDCDHPLRERVVHFFFPFSVKDRSWTHGRIGKGFDFLSIVATPPSFSRRRFWRCRGSFDQSRTHALALFCCLTSWPILSGPHPQHHSGTRGSRGLELALRACAGIAKKTAVMGVFFCWSTLGWALSSPTVMAQHR